MNQFKVLYAFLLLLIFRMPAGAQEMPIITADDFMQHVHESSAEAIEEQLQEEGYVIPEADTTAGIDWEEILRTSEIEGETGTQYRSGQDTRPKPKGKRIGSICMDGTESENGGRGACSGHGGVRYWLYEHEGEVTHFATRRHYEHPDPYTQAEKLGLAAYNEKPKEEEKAGEALGLVANEGLSGNFYQMIMVLIICMTAAYIGHLYFTSHRN